MNSYQFVLKYGNNGDARDGAKTLKAYLLQQGNPRMSESVRYNGPTVELIVPGNLSAVQFIQQLECIDAVYTVAPVGDSAPLPTITMVG